jgi:hypothetical protein
MFLNLKQYFAHLREDSLLGIDQFCEDVLPTELCDNIELDYGPIDPDLAPIYVLTLRAARRQKQLQLG